MARAPFRRILKAMGERNVSEYVLTNDWQYLRVDADLTAPIKRLAEHAWAQVVVEVVFHRPLYGRETVALRQHRLSHSCERSCSPTWGDLICGGNDAQANRMRAPCRWHNAFQGRGTTPKPPKASWAKRAARITLGVAP